MIREILLGALFALTLAACGGGGGGSSSSASGGTPSASANELDIVVEYGPRNIPNTAFTSVTLCAPGSAANCQTIDRILIDTGSSGLRIMEDALSPALLAGLPNLTQSGRNVGECISFADGSGIWGPLKRADVRLAGTVAQSTTIHAIGTNTLSQIPAACSGSMKNSTASFGAKGILGIGPRRLDCGSDCANSSFNDQYFACDVFDNCTSTALATSLQIANPVAALDAHNNGTVIDLPAPPVTGSVSLSGKLILGIGTGNNNALGSATILPLTFDPGIGLLSFPTRYKGVDYAGFIDSGSNALFFPDDTIADCALSTAFFCPAGPLALSATQFGQNGTSRQINFTVAAADDYGFGLAALPGLAGNEFIGAFDWGLPFFFGRKVFTAIENRNTPAGSGPYFAH